MTRLFLFLILSCRLALLPYDSAAQGCSDAGICTINGAKPEAASPAGLPNQFKTGIAAGAADCSISIFSSYATYSRRLSHKTGLSAKITSILQSGSATTSFGLSDVYLSADHKIAKATTFILGLKVPLSTGNKKKDGQPLPLDYQSSLGTLDAMAAISRNIKNLYLVAAYQQPLTQNKNEFVSQDYPAGSEWRAFRTTKGFKRSGDVLLRAAYVIALAKKIRLTPGLLPIYHLGNDRYTDASGNEKEITGSRGLTLNGNLYVDYLFTDKSVIQLNFGMPFIVRDARPDGLTRHFLATIAYSVSF